jgi:excinuclease ABC subunit C
MMTEILTRRFLSADSEKFGILPDLIVIDGGKGQLSAAKKVLDEFSLSMEIIGLAKKNEEIFIYNKGKEAGILEGTFKKIILPKDSHALFLLQRVRDEAHRFAISHHKLIREKKLTKTGIEEISGIGEKTAKALLKNFGSVRGIKKASLSELTEIVGRKKAETIKKSRLI